MVTFTIYLYKNDSFDIAFSHSVLSNLQKPTQALLEYTRQALLEYTRVVKSGGIVAIRESDFSSVLIYPKQQVLLKVLNVLTKIGNLYGDLFIGKKLRKLFYKVGLKNTIASASCESYGNSKDIKNITRYLVNQIKQSEIRHLIITNGWATRNELNEWLKTLNNFSGHDSSFFAYI